MAPEIKYTKLFIDNEWVDAKSGKTFETYNPHDGSVIAKVAEGDKADIDLAVAAAKRAFHRNSEWRQMDASKRGEILRKFSDLMERDQKYLAELESYNNGMVLAHAKTFIGGAVGTVRYFASCADKVTGETIPADGEVFSYTLRQPIGVCGLILPWNGPIFIFVSKVCTALAAGCTVVVKPAEQTPLTALVLAALLAEAGLPKGVLNVVNGFGPGAGSSLTHHSDVAKVSFTGSVEVGKLIQQASGASNLKRVTLELGGKSPLIIMNDADLNVAVPYAANAVFFHQGQICIAASRLFVQSGIYDKFVEAAVKYAQSIKVGNPADPTTQNGPQIDETMMNKVLGYIEKGKQEGAKLLCGGNRIGTSGYYIQPAVFVNVTDDMTIAREEIFGPVQSILKFDTLDEAIDRANATNYGLAAGIFTTNLNNALQFSKHVEAGTVWVNTYLHFTPQQPFGGFKESGIGRENGLDSLLAYTEVKTVAVALPKKLFIDNEWVDAKSGKTFETYSPHDGSVIARVAEADKEDVDLAVAAAKRAFHRNSEWRRMDASKRGEILYKFSDLVERDQTYLAELESYNNGTVLAHAKTFIGSTVGTVRFFASCADKVTGETIPADGEVFSYTLRQPVGVCALILPWNAPIAMFLSKVCTALAAGCTVVVKPAEQTPLTALVLAALLAEAGLPKGVVNVVTGFGPGAGTSLTHHSDVAKVSFTGSLEVGKLIQQASGASNLKRVTLELGGKSPLIIMNDADLNVAVPYAANAVFFLQGQICIAASRLFVQSGIYDKFVEAAVKYAQSIKVGNPADPTTQNGPQIDETMMNKVLGYIEKGKQEGAKLLCGGHRVGTSGYYIQPAVFANVTDDMTIAKEEIFGPVQSILKFDTLEEAIDRANATNYGLAAGIFTSNLNNALQFSKHVEAGTVWVNTYLHFAPQHPFGGFKESGIGRENGVDSLLAYTEVKTVAVNLPKIV
uniref:SFRICE_015281 n=1 Tax=Spodoptera frugiperda TaxID=7108 RepID=A0A2H1VZJ0_SPOFR